MKTINKKKDIFLNLDLIEKHFEKTRKPYGYKLLLLDYIQHFYCTLIEYVNPENTNDIVFEDELNSLDLEVRDKSNMEGLNYKDMMKLLLKYCPLKQLNKLHEFRVKTGSDDFEYYVMDTFFEWIFEEIFKTIYEVFKEYDYQWKWFIEKWIKEE